MVIFNSYVSLPEGTSLRKQTYCRVRVYVPLGLLVGQCLPWAARISNFHSSNVLVTILRESNMANMAFKKLHHLQSSIYTGFPRQTCLNAYGYNKQWGRSLIIQMWQMVAANLKPEVDQTQHSRKNDWSLFSRGISYDFMLPPKKRWCVSTHLISKSSPPPRLWRSQAPSRKEKRWKRWKRWWWSDGLVEEKYDLIDLIRSSRI